MSNLVSPCGDKCRLPRVKLSSRETGDVIMMGIGGFKPLKGFMAKDLSGTPHAYGRLS